MQHIDSNYERINLRGVREAQTSKFDVTNTDTASVFFSEQGGSSCQEVPQISTILNPSVPRLLTEKLNMTKSRPSGPKNAQKKLLLRKFRTQNNKKLIVNLSDEELNPALTSILSKGLKFIPTPTPTKWETIRSSFLRFRRQMYTRYFFRSCDSKQEFPFKIESCWDPPVPDNTNLVAYMSLVLDSLRSSTGDMYGAFNQLNLAQTELSFLNNFKPNPNYIIKPADKRGAIVIWSSHDYIAEAPFNSVIIFITIKLTMTLVLQFQI